MVKGLSVSVAQVRSEPTIKKLVQWIDKNIKYTPDSKSYGFDYIQSPAVTTRYGSGDCQDITALVASVLNTLNIPFRLAKGKLATGELHIWVEIDGDDCYFIDGTGPAYKKVDNCDFDRFYPKLDKRKVKTRTEWI